MRRALLALAAVLALTACSGSPQPATVTQTVTATPAVDVEARAVGLLRAALPGITDDEARKAMTDACEILDMSPTVAKVRELRVALADGAGGGVTGAAAAATVIGAAVAWKCPNYRSLVAQAD